MSRALRIEYEGAWYHIMNRGAGKQIIFHNETHYNLFLKLLSEIHNRYRIEVHAYCLMNNHYHLLIRTPLANLSRAMRHINGVYSQRYNGLQKTDGPLFRGRFKSIIIDSENYLLRLSRYIHLNPDHNHQTIAEHFSRITYAGVAKIYQRIKTKLQSDHRLAEEIFRLEMKIKI